MLGGKGKQGWNSSQRHAGSWLALGALCLWYGCVSSVFVSLHNSLCQTSLELLGWWQTLPSGFS